MTHLQLPVPDSSTRVLVLLDIEKAFDSVDWTYMATVLEVLGLGPNFLSWVKILCQIKLGGNLSEPFSIGCPQSPSLFALLMEPIAQAKRNSIDNKGIRVGSIIEKGSLYADDLVLFFFF